MVFRNVPVYTLFMVFTKRLRDGIRRGVITCSVRIWMRPHVKAGNRYRMEEGEIEVDSIQPIGFADITPALAIQSGFLGLIDLLKVAKHGKGENIYLVRFHYVPPGVTPPPDAASGKGAPGNAKESPPRTPVRNRPPARTR